MVNQSGMLSKTLVIGIILLFIGMTVNSSTGSIVEKKPFTVFNSHGYIQDLIDNASDGDTIYIPSGTYYEHIVIDKSISLIGADKNTTIIDGDGNNEVIIILADYVQIQKLTIQNGKQEEDGIDSGGIILWSNYSKIINNNIKNNYFSGIYLGGMSHDNIISNNLITNNTVGVYIYKEYIPIIQMENNIIRNNTFNFNNNGIYILYGRGEIVSGNTISNCVKFGIKISDRKKNIVNNNDIFSNDVGIDVICSSENLIFNNIVSDNSYAGITLIIAELNNISKNEIFNNNLGIELVSSEKNTIVSNNLSYNNKGLYFDYHNKRNNIKKNYFYDNHLGIHVSGQSNPKNIISNNQLFKDGFKIDSIETICENNTVNGKPFLYLLKESNKIFDNVDAGQIILAGCDSISINNHELSDTYSSIQLFDCTNCIISGNKISNNKNAGIIIKGNGNSIIGNIISNNLHGISIIDDDNLIQQNNISNNEGYGIKIDGEDTSIINNNIKDNVQGLYIDGISNKIKQNNFISNERDANFLIWRFNPGRNRWVGNYWSSFRGLVKIIFGIKVFVILILEYLPIPIPIPWINVDFVPAKEPYDIGA